MLRKVCTTEGLGFNAFGRIRISRHASKGRKLSASAPYVFGPGTALGLLPSIALSSAQADIDFIGHKSDWSTLVALDTTPEILSSNHRPVFQLKWDPKSVALTGATSRLVVHRI